MRKIEIEPIGSIETPFESVDNMPIQSKFASGKIGKATLFDDYKEGLTGLEEYSHIYLIYYLHRVERFKLKVIPFMMDKETGVFATRAPVRPSRIGLSIVKILEIRDGSVVFEGADMLNGTPLLDIKPYASRFDDIKPEKEGWLGRADFQNRKPVSDKRFE